MPEPAEADDIEATDSILGIAIIIKLLGFALFGGSLALVIVGSLLNFQFPFMLFLMIGLVMIVVGYALEKVLTTVPTAEEQEEAS